MIDLTNKTYRAILEQMLAQVPNTFDKRDTSPIQTALGPAAYALEEFYLNLNIVQRSAFIQSAEGDDLDIAASVRVFFRKSCSPEQEGHVAPADMEDGAAVGDK